MRAIHKLATANIDTVALKKKAIPDADMATKNNDRTYRKKFSAASRKPEK